VKEPSFEEALSRLEEIVRALEDGDAELDRTLSLFEEGVKLSKLCHKRLESAEKKIELLVKKEGKKPERRRVDEPGGNGETLSLLDEAE
jgi:exodeoxyribonuclease VII small subunit